MLCECSQKSIELFAEDKELREVFLSREIFREINAEEIVNFQMKKVLFLLSSKIILNLISVSKASQLLSNIIREKIKKITSDFSEKQKWKDDYFVAALGSSGNDSMSFASDVDLIFTARNIQKHRKLEQSFQEMLKLLRDNLTPFPVDCRLRPEGDSSQLVWELNGYRKYFQNRARIWELQSFLKAKYVCGNKRLFNSLLASYLKRFDNLNTNDVLKGINEIRTKALSAFPSEMQLVDLKKNSGGMNDIEYVAHYMVLSNKQVVKYFIGKSTPEVLIELSKAKKEWRFLKSLADNYIFLKELDILNQIVTGSISSKISEETGRLEKLAFLLKIKSGSELKKKLTSVFKDNRDAFNRFIN
jgi:glutamate-ammonia-ligase adenylyltransferase